MPNVLIRDVETTILEKLKKKATEHGRSVQSELLFIINDYVKKDPISDIAAAKKIKDALRTRRHSDSAALLKEDRAR